MLTMLIVDDEYLVRLGVKSTIQWEEHGIEIIGEASDGEIALEMAQKVKPDIILTDIRMPIMDGLELMAKLRETGIESSIIVLSGYDDFEYVRTAMHNGASAYILKPIDNQQLIDTVQNITRKIKNTKSTKQYYERLENELSSMKKQFIRDLVSGAIWDRNEIMEKIRFLDVPIDVDNNLVVVIRINQYDLLVEQNSVEEIKGQKEWMLQQIADLLLLNSKFMGIVVEKSSDEWNVLIHVNDSAMEVPGIIKEKCLELADRVRDRKNITVSIGISPLCANIEGIPAAFKQISSMLDSRLLPYSNFVLSSEDEIIGYRKEIKEAIRYISQNFAKDISVEAVAGELFISASYLMHLFKSEVGKTLSECLVEIRIEKAKELLRNPKYKIYEVSEMVGYSDSKYFSQIFKKLVGISPSEYVKQENL